MAHIINNINNNNLSMNTKTLTVLVCMLVLLWHLPFSCVRGTGGAMGPVVSLVHPTYGSLMAICALQARTFLPTCWGTLPVGKPTPTTQPMWAITAGADFICGLRYEPHTPICWGGNTIVTSIPSSYASTSYSSINAGYGHVCAVRDNSSFSPGTVDCWGYTSAYQIAPPNVAMLSVTSGDYYSCGITQASRKVVCWGEVRSVYMSGPPSDGQFKAIFSGRLHMCGIRLDGLTECWGGNSNLFTNKYPSRLFSSLVGTYYYTCGIDQLTHQATCWTPLTIPPTPTPYPYSYLSASALYDTTSYGTYVHYDYACGVREDVEVGNLYCSGTLKHSFTSSLSSFTASKGICREQCPEGQHPALTNGQCPNPNHQVCQDCQGACPSLPPSRNTSSSSSPSTPESLQNNKSSPSPSSSLSIVKIVVPVCVAVVFCIIAAFLIVRYCNHPCISRRLSTPEKGRSTSGGGSGNGLIIFSPEEIVAATNNFRTIIGKGGFGNVYKGTLPNRQTVAIKRPHKLTEGGRDYDVEFDMLSKLRHTSLVNLVGYCKQDNALVFPYMENGSLHDRMKDARAKETLSDTRLRLNIAMQVAKGLEYMHSCNVIHRDVKTSNILLDDQWNAYIADFGISRYSPNVDETHCTTRIIGTPAYLDPDYNHSGELTTKSDVYSLGVVLLELASGLGPDGLGRKARVLYRKGQLSNLVDHNLPQHCIDCRLGILDVAIQCVKQSRARRATMDVVVQQLQTLNDDLGPIS